MLRRIGGALRRIGADRLAFDVAGIARKQLLDSLGRGDVGHSVGRRIGDGSICPRQRDGDYKCSGKNATMSHRFSPAGASGDLTRSVAVSLPFNDTVDSYSGEQANYRQTLG